MSNVKTRPRETLVAQILENLDSPGAVFSPPQLVVCVGLPGAGKSTLSRRIAAATGAVVLESDFFRRLLFVTPTFDKDESRELFAFLYEAARWLLRENAAVIIDATNVRASDRDAAFAVARNAGAQATVLHIWAPEATIAERLREGEGDSTRHHSTAGLEVYRRLAETADPPPVGAIDIDTSNQAATEAALDRIVRDLNATKITPGRPWRQAPEQWEEAILEQ